jgi:hypothetical protein
MVVDGTPVKYYSEWRLWVKHEERCCPGGPDFSKTRGVYAWVKSRSEQIIGVLDTSHSRGGWAVARACSLLGKECHLYYPVRKADWLKSDLKPQQYEAQKLGACLFDLPAARSAVLYHRAKRYVEEAGGAMMPNALKLPETVEETKREFLRTELPPVNTILISASSGTIAAGVIAGVQAKGWRGKVVIHLGYSRSRSAVINYLDKMVGGLLLRCNDELEIVDEGYSYADQARPGPTPSWSCDLWYDCKAFRYFVKGLPGLFEPDKTLLWNCG